MRWDSENDLNSTPSTSVLLHKQNTGPSPSLEDVVRRRTPIWIQGLLKTHIDEDKTLEELFANCWLLGRISDAIHHILDERERTTGSPSPGKQQYTCPPQNLGERPYRAMLNDFEKFVELCDRLEIQEDSRITLTDVEQLRAGVKIGTCLWDVSNALHDKSATGELPAYVGRFVPKFAESERVFGVRKQEDGITEAMNLAKEFEKERVHHHDLDGQSDGGSPDVLTSILSPNKRKPAHTKVIHAVMMSGDDSQVPSPLPKIVDRHTSDVVTDEDRSEVHDATESRKTHRSGSVKRRGGDFVIHVHSKNASRHENNNKSSGRRRRGGVIVGVLGLVVASCVVVLLKKRKETKNDMHGRW
ncbi:hypothetical protein M9434_005272 [Picochlorum sp. BPE23]|nr:hypothetical protein M9434_005272 [Picochlorum sp. BPE23]